MAENSRSSQSNTHEQALRAIVKSGNILQADAPAVEAAADELMRLRKAIEHQVWWLISEGYDHAASSVAVYLYPGSAAPLRRYAQDHPEHAKQIDAISWVPKVTT